MNPKIQLIGVKKHFGAKKVLDGVDLTIEKNSSLVVIGGSGTGKSVMIKCVLGILRPDEGTILVDGEDVTHLSGAARDRCRSEMTSAVIGPRASWRWRSVLTALPALPALPAAGSAVSPT